MPTDRGIAIYLAYFASSSCRIRHIQKPESIIEQDPGTPAGQSGQLRHLRLRDDYFRLYGAGRKVFFFLMHLPKARAHRN